MNFFLTDLSMSHAKRCHFFCIVSIILKLPSIMRYYYSFHMSFYFPKLNNNFKVERPKTVFFTQAVLLKYRVWQKKTHLNFPHCVHIIYAILVNDSSLER